MWVGGVEGQRGDFHCAAPYLLHSHGVGVGRRSVGRIKNAGEHKPVPFLAGRTMLCSRSG